ncbi:LA2681-like HEPN [anaerobic digester metagenome]
MENEIAITISDYISNEILSLSEKFDIAFHKADISEMKKLISLSKELICKYKETLNLMQIYYDIGTGYSELRKLESSEEFLEYEILYLRKCTNLYYENELTPKDEYIEHLILKHIAVQAYVNLGNAFRNIGRHLMAIDNFYYAINIDNTFSMAYANLSGALFDFARLQYNSVYFNYLNHAGYYYYLKAVEYKENIHRPEAIEDITDYITNFSSEYLEEFLKTDINPPNLEIESNDEFEYRSSVGLHRLFLNPIEDILPNPCFWVDDIQLSLIDEGIMPIELIEAYELFTQIKSEYIYGRYLWFQAASNEGNIEELCEKNTALAYSDSLKADFSYRDFLAKTSFKILYSIFDKIGFFINIFWKLNIPHQKVDFSKSLTRKSGKEYIFNTDLSQNISLKSLYWIQKDLRSEERVFSTNPKAVKLADIRNCMEHRSYRTLCEKSDFDFKFTECEFRERLEINTVDLLKILKESIIYLALSVNEDILSKKKIK